MSAEGTTQYLSIEPQYLSIVIPVREGYEAIAIHGITPDALLCLWMAALHSCARLPTLYLGGKPLRCAGAL